jgi:hypothetical protein
MHDLSATAPHVEESLRHPPVEICDPIVDHLLLTDGRRAADVLVWME